MPPPSPLTHTLTLTHINIDNDAPLTLTHTLTLTHINLENIGYYTKYQLVYIQQFIVAGIYAYSWRTLATLPREWTTLQSYLSKR